MNTWKQDNIPSAAVQVLESLEQHRKEYWNIHPDAAAVLASLIVKYKPKQILEIGTSNGLSSILMGSLAATYGGSVTTIEFYDERVQLAQKHLEEAKVSNVTIMQADARELVQTILGLWDLVFIDAGKADYAHYLRHILPKLSENGYIVADNTISHRKSMKSFFEEIEKNPLLVSEEISVGDGLVIIRKKS